MKSFGLAVVVVGAASEEECRIAPLSWKSSGAMQWWSATPRELGRLPEDAAAVASESRRARSIRRRV